MDSIERRDVALECSGNPDEWQKSGGFDKYVARQNITNPVRPIATKSATVHLWMKDQYDKDLFVWEEGLVPALGNDPLFR